MADRDAREKDWDLSDSSNSSSSDEEMAFSPWEKEPAAKSKPSKTKIQRNNKTAAKRKMELNRRLVKAQSAYREEENRE